MKKLVYKRVKQQQVVQQFEQTFRQVPKWRSAVMLLTCYSSIRDSCNFIICSTYSCYQPPTCAPMTGYSDHLVHDHHSKWRNACKGAHQGKRVVFPHWRRERKRSVVNYVSRSMCVLNICLRVIHSNMNAGRQAGRVIGRQPASES